MIEKINTFDKIIEKKGVGVTAGGSKGLTLDCRRKRGFSKVGGKASPVNDGERGYPKHIVEFARLIKGLR